MKFPSFSSYKVKSITINFFGAPLIGSLTLSGVGAIVGAVGAKILESFGIFSLRETVRMGAMGGLYMFPVLSLTNYLAARYAYNRNRLAMLGISGFLNNVGTILLGYAVEYARGAATIELGNYVAQMSVGSIFFLGPYCGGCVTLLTSSLSIELSEHDKFSTFVELTANKNFPAIKHFFQDNSKFENISNASSTLHGKQYIVINGEDDILRYLVSESCIDIEKNNDLLITAVENKKISTTAFLLSKHAKIKDPTPVFPILEEADRGNAETFEAYEYFNEVILKENKQFTETNKENIKIFQGSHEKTRELKTCQQLEKLQAEEGVLQELPKILLPIVAGYMLFIPREEKSNENAPEERKQLMNLGK
jgi:hypothetical protein